MNRRLVLQSVRKTVAERYPAVNRWSLHVGEAIDKDGNLAEPYRKIVAFASIDGRRFYVEIMVTLELLEIISQPANEYIAETISSAAIDFLEANVAGPITYS